MDKADCEEFRRRIKSIADEMNTVRRSTPPVFTDLEIARQHSEAIANVTLAYRHLEDASMRLGKAIQAIDGGASVYDITQVPRST